jgi:5-amino-6-(5-phosphoribosylamino)uracil reductase
MIASVDGAATGPDDRSGGLATPADRTLFHQLRGLADAVIVGAGTVRDEDYGPARTDEQTRARRVADGQSPRPRLVVVSASMSLDPQARLFGGTDRVLVVTSRAADRTRVEQLREVADLVRVGDDAVDLPQMLGVLADQGLRRLLCEGGPGLLGDLVSGRLLDELCLTVAPVLTAGDARRIAVGGPAEPPLGMALGSMWLTDDGTVFTRWVRS